jgi:anaerobic ribonucleoside-triphosphate reductase activating protein
MKIAINKAHYPVTVLGPGRRIGIWLQGCRMACKGCLSQDTWPTQPHPPLTVAQLLAWCQGVSTEGFEGVTISGGEPFDQAHALNHLLDVLNDWRHQAGLSFDILCYSGYPLSTLRAKHANILAKLDALIPEPFIEAQALTHLWRGSANQPLVLLSALGQARYAEFVEAPADSRNKRIQTMIQDGRVWYVGIPARGDLEALEKACAERGVVFTQASWR